MKTFVRFIPLFIVLAISKGNTLGHSDVTTRIIAANGQALVSVFEGIQPTEWGRQFNALQIRGESTIRNRSCRSAVLNLDDSLSQPRLRPASCSWEGVCEGNYIQLDSGNSGCNGCPVFTPNYNDGAMCQDAYKWVDTPCKNVCCSDTDHCTNDFGCN